jgi:hypothetical protein
MRILQGTQQLHKALLKKRFTQLHNKSVQLDAAALSNSFVLGCMACLHKDWGSDLLRMVDLNFVGMHTR